jgi:hypothetical protein
VHGSPDEGEQAAGQSSMDNSSDDDSVNYPVCSVTLTTQEAGTSDICDHRIPVEPPRQQSKCDREDRELVCGEREDSELVCGEEEDLGWQLPLASVVVGVLYLYAALRALAGYISH